MSRVPAILTLVAMAFAAYFFLLDSRSAAVVALYRPAPPPKVKKDAQALLEPIPGDKTRYRVVMKPRAAERLGIKLMPVREEAVVRTRTLAGEVIVGEGGKLLLAVPLAGLHDRPTPGKPARVLAAASAKPIASATPAEGTAGAAHFLLDGGQELKTGARVLAEVELGGGARHRIVPVGAIIYDARGNTSVYVQTRPLAFLREPVKVAFIEGGRAVLADGPAAGTLVVAEGAIEVHGAEGRIGSTDITSGSASQ